MIKTSNVAGTTRPSHNRSTVRPGVTWNVNRNRNPTQTLTLTLVGLPPKSNDFFRGPRGTFPSNFVKIG